MKLFALLTILFSVTTFAQDSIKSRVEFTYGATRLNSAVPAEKLIIADKLAGRKSIKVIELVKGVLKNAKVKSLVTELNKLTKNKSEILFSVSSGTDDAYFDILLSNGPTAGGITRYGGVFGSFERSLELSEELYLNRIVKGLEDRIKHEKDIKDALRVLNDASVLVPKIDCQVVYFINR